jgi:hypothetical protein
MLHRIREAMQDKTATKLAGEVEVDESFIDGKSRKMHKDLRERVITGTGGTDKAIAFDMVERGGNVRPFAVPTRRKHELHAKLRENVAADSALFTERFAIVCSQVTGRRLTWDRLTGKDS